MLRRPVRIEVDGGERNITKVSVAILGRVIA
jgi:hypothetical protein